MSTNFSTLDYAVFGLYVVLIVGIGLWISRTKKGEVKTADDYFLANKSLTWWAIGASLLAANISAEHFIAMSGSGFITGLGIAVYEWMGALTLIVVGKYFLPIFIEKKIYTMPQFLQMRFTKGVSTVFAVFWLLVYVFVNLTTVSYLGALAMEKIMGVPLMWGILGLALIAGVYSIYGGLKAVAWTDVIQVIFLIGGGLVTTFLALNAVGGGNILHGFSEIYEKARDHFDMILTQGQMMIPDTVDPETGATLTEKDAFYDLPGLAVLFGAMWITNFGYWGFNQYIIQKGLAAKSLEEAKKGLVFAGYLKLLIPLLVIIPGITAYVLTHNYSHEELSVMIGKPIEAIGEIGKSDEAYPWLLKNFVPAGLRGLAFAALVAAIVSSLASMINSTSTIFTMDIYKNYMNKEATNKQMVFVGRIVAFVALFIATIAAQPLLGGLDQAFQYIQEFTGFIYPGVCVVFFMGLFWRQATTNAAWFAAAGTFVFSIIFKIVTPDAPFQLRMGYVFMILVFGASLISFLDKGKKVQSACPESFMGKAALKAGWGLIVAAVIGVILGLTLSKPLEHLAFSSIYMFSVMLAFVGGIIITNVKMNTADAKAIEVDKEIFKTKPGFNIAAIGIVVIFILLYFLFW